MAFPRLNAFSYWIFLFAGLFMYASFLIGDVARRRLVRLRAAHRARRTRPASTSTSGASASSSSGSRRRSARSTSSSRSSSCARPGMTVNRMPLFVWSILAMAFMMIFAVPAVTAGVVPARARPPLRHGVLRRRPPAASALLYQHLFWFWGHPEVYILFLPAVGIMLDDRSRCSRAGALAGYLWVGRRAGRDRASSASACGSTTCSPPACRRSRWGSSRPPASSSRSRAASSIFVLDRDDVAGPRALARRRCCSSLGFLLIFLLGGLTGVMVAVLPFDWQVTDSYFVVAHFHYVLNGAVVFPIFGGALLLVAEDDRPDALRAARQASASG